MGKKNLMYQSWKVALQKKKRDVGVLKERLKMSQQHALAANKSNSISDYTKKSIPRSRNLLHLLCTSKITSEVLYVFSSELLTARIIWTCWIKSSKGLLRSWRDWSIFHIRRGWEIWNYLALKKEGSGSTLLMGMYVWIKKSTSAILSCVRGINSIPENSVSASSSSFFTVRVVKHRNRLPSYVVQPWNIFGYWISLEMFQTWLNTEQAALGDYYSRAGVSLDNLQRFLPASRYSLWFHKWNLKAEEP